MNTQSLPASRWPLSLRLSCSRVFEKTQLNILEHIEGERERVTFNWERGSVLTRSVASRETSSARA